MKKQEHAQQFYTKFSQIHYKQTCNLPSKYGNARFCSLDLIGFVDLQGSMEWC